MSEKKKQEYTTGGLKNRQDVENALASAEYRPSQEVTDAASDLKQWQANRPGDYESAYQGRIDGLMEDLLDRKEFSYSYGADPLYRQYAQLYTQNAQNASADAAAQAAALTGGYGSSYAASAARQAYQQQIGALSEAIPTLYRLALDTYQSGGDALVEQIDQLNGQEQNARQKYERELADYYTQLEQKGNAYNTAYTQDYGRYQDYLGQLDSLYGYYAAQEQQEAARRQQGFNNVMTVLGLLGDAAQLAITGTTGLGSMAGSLLNTGYNIYAGNRAYEAERADTAWKQKMQEQLRQDEACLGGQAERCLQTALRADGAYLTAPFLACHPAVQGRALREAARRAGMPMRDLSQTHIEALERLLSSADPSAQLDLPHGFTARREYDAFRIAPRACGGQPEALPLTVPFDGLWTDGTRVKLRKLEKSEVFYKTVNTFCADCGTIDFASLCVRARQTGDRLRLTEKGGSRTLKKLMIDRKIPAAERDALAVIADRSGVIAVQDIGMDLSRRPGNGARLEIKIERN